MNGIHKPVVVVGSINVDFVASAARIPHVGETITGDDFHLHFGGKGANQAVAVARLGYPVEMIGRVGSDSFGADARSQLADSGVGVHAVEVAEGTSGIAAITVSRSGENAIVVVPGANAHVTPAYLDRHADLIQRAGLVLAQLEIPLATISRLAELCARWHIPLILDPAPAAPLSPEILRQVSWFTPNETEAKFFANRIDPSLVDADPEPLAQAFLSMGVQGVALKLGVHGVLLADSRPPRQLPAPQVPVVDTTAAGDAFNGAFATALMLGMEPAEAARFACAAAALSVTRPGAQASMPSRSDVEQLLRQESVRQ